LEDERIIARMGDAKSYNHEILKILIQTMMGIILILNLRFDFLTLNLNSNELRKHTCNWKRDIHRPGCRKHFAIALS